MRVRRNSPYQSTRNSAWEGQDIPINIFREPRKMMKLRPCQITANLNFKIANKKYPERVTNGFLKDIELTTEEVRSTTKY